MRLLIEIEGDGCDNYEEMVDFVQEALRSGAVDCKVICEINEKYEDPFIRVNQDE